MFMYAFYLYIKNKYNESVYFDDKYYKNDISNRRPELSILFPDYPVYKFHFNPAGEVGFLKKIYELKQKFLPSFNYINEINFDIDKDYVGNTYFNGYWQSEYYLNNLNLKHFSPKQDIPKEISSLKDMILSSNNSVSVHFRRKDYFSPKYIDKFGVCTTDYYQRAISYLLKKVEKAKLFVFSDDLPWVRNNIFLPPNSIYVPNYEVNSYWYIYLMSLCHYNIISNSTFSWWGAYLNKNEDKIVIGPSVWKYGEKKTLMCNNWIKIDI